MKPRSEANEERRGRNSGTRFPIIDCRFQALPIDRYYGGSTGSSRPSFLNISREYLHYEARRNFLVEVAFFLFIAAFIVSEFIIGACSVIHFLNISCA